MSRPVIAIDGPGGAGKSTVARSLAAKLGLARLDTGAMYRAVTLVTLRLGIDPDDETATSAVAERLAIEIVDDDRVLVDGEDVTAEIRSPEVDAVVSVVAAQPRVRAELVARQRRWVAAHDGGVVEGRDIASVVAPDADVKVFLTADPEVRASRRAAQTAEDTEAPEGAALVAAGDSIGRRDLLDSRRSTSPLAVAPGAVVVDSTGKSVEDVVDEVIALL